MSHSLSSWTQRVHVRGVILKENEATIVCLPWFLLIGDHLRFAEATRDTHDRQTDLKISEGLVGLALRHHTSAQAITRWLEHPREVVLIHEVISERSLFGMQHVKRRDAARFARALVLESLALEVEYGSIPHWPAEFYFDSNVKPRICVGPRLAGLSDVAGEIPVVPVGTDEMERLVQSRIEW